jgi:hypothetical protein
MSVVIWASGKQMLELVLSANILFIYNRVCITFKEMPCKFVLSACIVRCCPTNILNMCALCIYTFIALPEHQILGTLRDCDLYFV